MSRSSRFGHVEKLPSGKWRARCTGPDRVRRSATFRTKTDARVWLSSIETSVAQKTWRPPEAGRITIGEYAEGYISRIDLRPSTRALYESTWRNHLREEWERVAVIDATRERVRLWHGNASKTTKPTALAISYRLLRSILNVAVGDGAIPANPCQIKSAAAPKPATPARTLTAAEVQAVAEAMPARYRALVLMLGFGGLRFGGATALRRSDVAPDGGTVTIVRSVRYLDGEWVLGPAKTEARQSECRAGRLRLHGGSGAPTKLRGR